jgi:hypothetical protein
MNPWMSLIFILAAVVIMALVLFRVRKRRR